MQFRYSAAVATALVVLICFETASLAGTAARLGFNKGYVRYFGKKKIPLKQPAPVQSVANVNVKDFGATGDGTTDDTGAIQNAIAAAKAAAQGVFFPPGTYLHTDIITANGVALIGSGGGSTLLANNPSSSAVILSGVSPSIQNIVVSSQAASDSNFTDVPNFSTLAVIGAQNFIVQSITVLQGASRPGVNVQQSAVGQISGVACFGDLSSANQGMYVLGCANVSLIGNSIINEEGGIVLGNSNPTGPQNSSIAIIANTITTVLEGIDATDTNTMSIDQNQISASQVGILVGEGVGNYSVASNTISGADIGLGAATSQQTGTISQNIIRNSAFSGIEVHTDGTGNVQVTANRFGECGLTGTNVMLVDPGAGPNSIQIFNNVYAGHQNSLIAYIISTAHLNFVSGNVQTQTALPNDIP